MTLAFLEGHSAHIPVVPNARLESVRAQERDSDVWPAWSTELSPTELAEVARKNRLSKVLREIAGAVAYSVGLVVFLMAILSVLHVR